MQTRSPRAAQSRSKSGATKDKRNTPRKSRGATKNKFEDVTARAARLGITIDKVLQEYARIAFANPRHIALWDETGVHVTASKELSDADAATVHEISGGGAAAVHVKLYDKKSALDAIARYLGMFPAAGKERKEAKPDDPAEDPREELRRRLARLAASLGEEPDC